MKKILLLSIGIALSVACQQENTPGSPEQKTGTDYLASLECFDGPTKTSMTEDNGIVWKKGDQIAIFQGATVADTYQVKDQCDGTASGIFTLVSDNSEVNGEFSSGMEIPANIAVYPYSEGLGCSSATVTDGGITATSYTISGFDFPSVQQYQANSFAQESFAMVAVTSSMSDHNLRFRNVNGALKLQLRGKCVVKSIKLEGNDNEKLAGASSITAYPGTTVPSIKMSSEATGAITLDCGEGVQLDPSVPTIFIISVPPTVFSKGFTVTVVDTEGTEMPVRASVSNEIKRSSILKMPAVTVPVVSTETENIVFEDEVMKELCVKAFDTNGDGELSYTEAAAVTDLSKMTLTKKTFKTFNEFQYFTSVKTVPSSYFSTIGLREITFPKSITTIGSSAFKDCINLNAVVMSEGVKTISSYAFSGCTKMTSIYLPESVTSIGYKAFSNCSSLTSITIPGSVTSIGDRAFYECSSLTSINIPESVTSIEYGAFYGCSSLTSISIPKSVTSIGDWAFYGCRGLTSISIPESVTSIGDTAFYGCSSLTSISIPESVTSIGNYTFSLCSSLISIGIPESVTSIGDYTFQYCSSLTSISIPESVTSIGGGAFYNCRSLTNISIPESVTAIGDYAFDGCSSLTSITIPESVASIGGMAFVNCRSLTSTYIKATSLRTYGPYAFDDCPTKIYVPSGSEETYKAGWPSYASRIVSYDYSAAQ
ncbi:MAG: leucine-rich repeat domain-containing protein [Candidatus Cryptobacteroides sp.]|uniref:leucine-rich repeat domain-containing protein n=1 Tax=Candidatus Cryptobacteroides sp. TaxID=2952915 RepID=UPI002A802858|nr:leucine-rich repeat domain-containing protein [Candidatus Cryptobacteroides sp.]MDY5042848.1 leucine-rich repeat domain-containing protein [Candidatus Cryptobacteroides sp.]